MDERSFDALYDRIAAPLRGYVARALGDRTRADDIVQETYLRLLRSPPRTDDVQELRAIVYRIASNLIVDHWRQSRREQPMPEDRVVDVAVPAADASLRVDMTRMFSHLAVQQRQMLWLAYFSVKK